MSQPSLSDYNDKNYPIEPIWLLKGPLISLISLPFFMVFLIFIYRNDFSSLSKLSTDSYRSLLYIGFFIIAPPLHFIANVIRRATFHYQFDEKFLNLRQGLIRRQNRQLPFGVIQNVLVTRGILDRLFGLSTVIIQNATQSTVKDVKAQTAGYAGFFGNTIQIPGLSKDNAEKIKNALLEKIKDSPTIELGM